MAKYKELSPCIIGHECYVLEGDKAASTRHGQVIDETKVLVRISLENDPYEYRFSKKDMKPFGSDKRFIKDLTLVLPNGLD